MCKEILILNYQPRPVTALSGSGKHKKNDWERMNFRRFLRNSNIMLKISHGL